MGSSSGPIHSFNNPPIFAQNILREGDKLSFTFNFRGLLVKAEGYNLDIPVMVQLAKQVLSVNKSATEKEFKARSTENLLNLTKQKPIDDSKESTFALKILKKLTPIRLPPPLNLPPGSITNNELSKIQTRARATDQPPPPKLLFKKDSVDVDASELPPPLPPHHHAKIHHPAPPPRFNLGGNTSPNALTEVPSKLKKPTKPLPPTPTGPSPFETESRPVTAKPSTKPIIPTYHTTLPPPPLPPSQNQISPPPPLGPLPFRYIKPDDLPPKEGA